MSLLKSSVSFLHFQFAQLNEDVREPHTASPDWERIALPVAQFVVRRCPASLERDVQQAQAEMSTIARDDSCLHPNGTWALVWFR